MKVSLNWIKDYVDLPADMDLKRLAYDLTMSTVEVEDTIELAKQFDHMGVGRIKTIEQHPNADKLKVCKTDIGGEVKDIVCGGSNLTATVSNSGNGGRNGITSIEPADGIVVIRQHKEVAA